MRTILALALTLVFVAGCTSPSDDAPATPTPATTPEPTPATPTPAMSPEPVPPTATPTPATTVPPPAPAPEPPVNRTFRHDYSNSSAGVENISFVIPPGQPALAFTVQFDAGPTAIPGQYGCVGALRIKVFRPDLTLQYDVTASPGTGTANSHCGQVSAGGTFPTDIPAGEWHVAFEGSGVGIGWVRIAPATA